MYKKYTLILLFLFFIGCGQRADLIIKPLPIPLPPSEIKISQRGNNLILELIYPEQFENGEPYNRLDKIEIQGYIKDEKNEKSDIKFKSLYSKENIIFDKSNKTILEFKLPDKTGSILFHIISKYKKYNNKSEQQQFDFIKSFKPPILKKPEISEEGIKLSWKSKTPFPYYGIYKNDFKNIYKIIDGFKDNLIDSEIEYNKKTKYAITGISKKSPLTETLLSNIIEIIPKDNFPPPQVKNIKYLFLENNKILINWDKVFVKDLKGYNLYYRFGENKFKKYNKEPILENTITIDAPLKRKIISIYICSIDTAGNESEKSEIIELR
jgi:hypothetical protein